MYYQPRLSDGKYVELPWQLRLFFFNSNWPLSEDATWWMKIIDRFIISLDLLIFTIVVESEYNYIVKNRNNLGLVLETLATAMVSTECFLRIFNMAFRRQNFRDLIKIFYSKIYIERSSETECFCDEIERKSIPTRICSYTYFTTLFTFYIIPIVGFCNKQLLFPFRMLLHYDSSSLEVYIPTLLSAVWAGNMVVMQLVAEANMLATLILNLNGRYLLLQQELRELFNKVHLQCNHMSPDYVVQKYHEGLLKIVRQNFRLNRFAHQMQLEYSFRIFVMMGLSALLLCVLGFKVVTVGWSSSIVTYVLWICTKTVELLVFGELGSRITETTDRMSITYYLSNWEEVVLHSGNSRENIKIMKLISMAICLNRNPICFTGLDFFNVRLPTVITILRGAGSYFTCLYALY